MIKGILTDSNGVWSSKRFVGVISAISLITYMFVYPSETANNSVLVLAIGGLGLTSIDKIFKKNG